MKQYITTKIISPSLRLIILILSVLLFSVNGCTQNTTSQNNGETAEHKTETLQSHTAPADLESEPIELFTYEYDNNNEGIRLISYSGTKIKVKISDTIEDLPVVSIGAECFTVGEVTEIYYPDTLKVFEWGGKKSKKLLEFTQVTIPYGVTVIVAETFKDCILLSNIIIPNSVMTIGTNAFRDCNSLSNITIPSSVIEIGEFAFHACTSMTHINVDNNNTMYIDINGVLFTKDKTTLIKFPGGKEGIYTIPASVTKIYRSAFNRCSLLTSVTISESVTEIGIYVFAYCSSLTSVKIPESITKIDDRAFLDCTSLTTFTIPDSITEIHDNAFLGCSSLSEETKQRILQINPNANFN